MNRFLTYAILLTAVLFAACSDDDHFSTSSSLRLSFSTDTVKLDTVFSLVPSATQTFWVFNNSSDGIRCSSIRLANGNQTGFRINVNGVYLGEEQGYLINDEEVRKGDSLRVFVELTSPISNALTSKEIGDDIVFNLENGTTQKVHLKAWTWDAELLHNVVVSHDSTMTSDKPIVVYGGITIKEGATMTIPAGQTIYMHADAGINVHGTLKCEGTQNNEVTLRGDRLDRMFDYLPYDGVSGQWKGIHFFKTSYGNKLAFTDIHSASNAIKCDSSRIDTLKLDISNSTIHNSKGDGVYLISTKADITNTLISNTLGNCLYVSGGDVNVNNSTIAQFYPFDAARGDALVLTNKYDTIATPIKNFAMRNSIVTGYAEDVISCYFADDIEKNFLFDHCLLRTPAVDDTLTCKNIIWEDPKDTTLADTKNFKKIDTKLLQYDFHLSEKSLGKDKADTNTSLPTDREGTLRDDKPDMGCFENQTSKDSTTP